MDLQNIRALFQWCSLILSNAYFGFLNTKQVYQGSLKSMCVPVLNCNSCPSALFSCPIGTFQHFMTIRKFPYLLTAYLALIGISVGSLACGWLCPFGLMQDLLYKIKSVKLCISERLSSLRYLILFFLVILFPLVTQETWFSKVCPMGTFEAAIPWVLWNPIIPVYGEPAVSTQTLDWLFIIKLLISFGFLGFFIIAKRPFCRLACPLGAIFGFFNKYSILQLKVDAHGCTECQKCKTNCPVDINISDNPGSSTCVRCFHCLKCEHVRIQIGLDKLPTIEKGT